MLRNAPEIVSYMEKMNILPTEGKCAPDYNIRTHHLVGEVDVSLVLPERGMVGTQSFYEVQSTGVQHIIKAQKHTCLCDYCIWGKNGPCHYGTYAGDLK